MKLNSRKSLTLCALLGSLALPASATVTLPPIISNNMVLQRDAAVPIWGTADPGEDVKVQFRDQTKTAKADEQGKWKVVLDKLDLGDPGTMTISGSNTITLEHVLVGEVWVGSGQSNIDTPVQVYTGNDPAMNEAAQKEYPQLRLFHSTETNKGWQAATPDNLRGFSAQLFYFGMKLQQQLNVPVGVIEAAVQGSPSANWITDEVVKSDPDIQAALASHEKYQPYAEMEKRYQEILAARNKNVADAIAALPPPADGQPAPTVEHPPEAILKKYPWPWHEPPYGSTRGARGDFYAKHIQPLMPYAIKGVLWDQGEGGTNISSVPQDIVMHALIALWRKDWGQGDFPWIYVQKPSGEGCALNPDDPINRGCRAFQPNLPKEPASNAGGRFEYINTMKKNANTYMATSSDLATGVHPPNKSGYGTRDAQVALGGVYGVGVEYYGPLYDSFKVEGDKLRLSFTHVGKGLTTIPNQKLQGFAIAGADKRFYWADAVIDGQTVVLSSPKVPNPVAARYAYDWGITWADLFNADGLPALTFRTDNW